MPDYQEMYLGMVRETEKAINLLINAQRKCEEMYIKSSDNDVENSDNDVACCPLVYFSSM